MAEQVDIQPILLAVEEAMRDLVGRVKEEANYRGKVATGGTIAALRTSVMGTDRFVVGTMTGPEHWRYVGNGRGPGRMPPVSRLQAWINSRGLSLSAWAVAKRIAAQGSRDYRLKRTNIFNDSIKAWEESDLMADLRGAVTQTFGDAYVTSVQNAFKPAA